MSVIQTTNIVLDPDAVFSLQEIQIILEWEAGAAEARAAKEVAAAAAEAAAATGTDVSMGSSPAASAAARPEPLRVQILTAIVDRLIVQGWNNSEGAAELKAMLKLGTESVSYRDPPEDVERPWLLFTSLFPSTHGLQCAYYFLSNDVRTAGSKQDGKFPQVGLFPGFYKAGPKHVAVLDALGWSAADIEQAKYERERARARARERARANLLPPHLHQMHLTASVLQTLDLLCLLRQLAVELLRRSPTTELAFRNLPLLVLDLFYDVV